MKTSLAPLLIVVSTWLAAAADPTNSAVPEIRMDGVGDLMSSCEVRGKRYELNLSPKRLISAPAWKIKAGKEPNLSPAKALLAARQELLKTFADGAAWEVERISVEHFPEPAGVSFGLRDRWYYEISFSPPEALEGQAPFPQEYRVYVLMDGSVIAPRERKQQSPKSGASPSAAPPHR